MHDTRFEGLFDRYMTRQASPEEEAELMGMLACRVSDEEREAVVGEWFDRVPESYCMSAGEVDRMFRRIVGGERRYRLRRWGRAVAVAAGIAVLVASGFFFLRPGDPVGFVAETDIFPGSKRAILTLMDGSRLPVDTLHEGEIAREGVVAVVNRDNMLVYEARTVPAGDAEQGTNYHLLSTPNGAYYEMVLPDGSRVWLNAASSIRYPLSFAGGERRVEITGEVYFEVESRVDSLTNRRVPFVVAIGDRAEVEVLGTRFNINGYEDEEAVRTTLLEGSVRFLSRATREVVLVRPGEQVCLGADGRPRLDRVNTGEVMAWKEGKFVFDKVDIRAIMRQISRWYDVEVEYRGEVACHFGGTISRDVNISKVFNVLEQTGSVRFSMENNRVIVMP
jgi:ferric-dicitrate binding protein FerR (iron transport regulator)